MRQFPDWSDLSSLQRSDERERCLERLAACKDVLNATVAITTGTGPPHDSLPLEGLPYATKDMFDRPERRAGWGGVRPSGPPPSHTAEVLRRLDTAGGWEVAVSSMTELAYEPSGFNATRGRTLNPWHPGVVSGGSSSGSAVIVASGAAVLGLGSDTGGSIRIPASCCGVTGLKPTAGAVPVEGAMPLAPSLDVIGFFARSACDLTAVWPVASGEVPADQVLPVETAVVLADCVEMATDGIKIAFARGCHALAGLGLRIESTRALPTIEEADRHALLVMQAEAARTHGALLRDREAQLNETLARRIAKGFQIEDAILAAALDGRERLRVALFEKAGCPDVMLVPTIPFEVPLAAETDPRSRTFDPKVLYRLGSLMRFVNFLGLPALSVPVGFDARGVPIGLQVIGRLHEELRLLDLGTRLQKVTDWHARMPPSWVATLRH